MLTAKSLEKTYGSLKVLKGIDLTIQKKEIVSIVGASGAGKSTLLHILGTLDSPDVGSVTLNHTNPFTLRKEELAKFRNEKIGFIFQFHNLLPEFSALENISMPGLIGKKKIDDVKAKAEELMDLLNISHRKNHKPSELSGGEQQRAAVARALINAPEIIFADEPSGNLDTKNAEELHKLFFDLRDKFSQTFVIVTHNSHLASISDRMLEIEDGKIKL